MFLVFRVRLKNTLEHEAEVGAHLYGIYGEINKEEECIRSEISP